VNGRLGPSVEAVAQAVAQRAVEIVVSALDVNALLDRVDLNAVLDQVDIGRVLDRIERAMNSSSPTVWLRTTSSASTSRRWSSRLTSAPSSPDPPAGSRAMRST
jgi:hypothetical protein